MEGTIRPMTINLAFPLRSSNFPETGLWNISFPNGDAPSHQRARLDVNSKVWLGDLFFCDPTIESCANAWKLNDDGTVYMIFQTKIRADKGGWATTTDPYRVVTCNLQPDRSGKTLEGSCIDGIGKTQLRLSR